MGFECAEINETGPDETDNLQGAGRQRVLLQECDFRDSDKHHPRAVAGQFVQRGHTICDPEDVPSAWLSYSTPYRDSQAFSDAPVSLQRRGEIQ